MLAPMLRVHHIYKMALTIFEQGSFSLLSFDECNKSEAINAKVHRKFRTSVAV